MKSLKFNLFPESILIFEQIEIQIELIDNETKLPLFRFNF